MRKLRHAVVVVTLAVSTLLFLAIIVLWIRSAWRRDLIEQDLAGPPHRLIAIASNSGSLSFVFRRQTANVNWRVIRLHRPNFEAIAGWTYWNYPAGSRTTGNFGFSYGASSGPPFYGTEFSVPHWLLAFVFGSLAALCLRMRLRSRRRLLQEGVACTACGYDLRATPTRCPECGTVAETMNDERGTMK